MLSGVPWSYAGALAPCDSKHGTLFHEEIVCFARLRVGGIALGKVTDLYNVSLPGRWHSVGEDKGRFTRLARPCAVDGPVRKVTRGIIGMWSSSWLNKAVKRCPAWALVLLAAVASGEDNEISCP